MAFAHELSLRGHTVFLVVECRSLTRYVRNLYTRHPLLPQGSKAKILWVRKFADLPDEGVFIADSWQVAKKLHEMPVTGAKFHYIQHDERMHHGDRDQVERVYRLPLIKMVNATWLQKLLKKDLDQDVSILFNAIDCSLFNPDKRNRKADDKSIRIAVLHHDYAWKGTKDGVQIVQRLKAKYPEKNIKLILFGTREKNISYPCDEYHYNAVGVDLATLFANSDIYIGPSSDDSRAILHRWVMASGCAIAIYDNVRVDGETALIAKKGDVSDLLKKTETLVINENLRRELAGNALEYVLKLPTWKELTDQLENIFNEALKTK